MTAKAAKKLSSISWKAKSYLADVEFLEREVEFTYFRLLQGIYLSQNQFPDNDATAARFCKCKSLREYRAHKAELLKSRGIDPETGLEISPRIYVFSGTIRSEKCDEQLGHASKLRAQKSGAGTASSEAKKKTKALKGHNTGSTGVGTAGTTAGTTGDTTGRSTAASTAGALPLTLNPLEVRTPHPLRDQVPPESPAPPATGTHALKTALQDWEQTFDKEFWPAYPKRDGGNPRKPAKEKFIAACRRGEDPRAIIAGVKAYAAHPSTKHDTSFIAQATRWLNEERWKDYAASNDDPPPAKINGTPVNGIPTIVDGHTPSLQLTMAKKYLLHWRANGDSVVFEKPKKPEERRWTYKDYAHPETPPFPPPGQPGCPVSPEAMRAAAAECGVTWPE